MANILKEKAQIQERPFRSETPVVGGLIVRLRSAWNNMAARWYVQGLFEQQNAFNGLVADQATNLEGRVATQDREIAHLTKTVAELEAQVKSLSKQLAQNDNWVG